MRMNKPAIEWLYRQLKKARIDHAHVEEQDAVAAENIRRKIEVIEHLIGLVLKEDDNA
jgi:hypothetical protein